MNRSPPKRLASKTSDELLRYLSYIGDALKNAKQVKRDKNGSTVVALVLDAPTVRLKHIRELGAVLESVASGDDAHKVFRQDELTKPKKTDLHKMMALAYWSVRAMDPKAKDTAALRHAREVSGQSILDSTFRKQIAQRYRDSSMRTLAGMSAREMPGVLIQRGSKTYIIENRSPEQVDALREHLRKKSPRKTLDE